MAAETGGGRPADRTRSVLQRAPGVIRPQPNGPARHPPARDGAKPDNSHYRRRFLKSEYDRWMSTKRKIKVEEDHIVVKVLLDFFQSHGGFNWHISVGSDSAVSCKLLSREVPATDRSLNQCPAPAADRPAEQCQGSPTDGQAELDNSWSADDAGCASAPSETEEERGGRGTPPPPPLEEEEAEERERDGRGTPPPPPPPPPPEAEKERLLSEAEDKAAGVNDGRRPRTQNRTRSRGAGETAAAAAAEDSDEESEEEEGEDGERRAAPELPAVDPQLVSLFRCGLCGAGQFASLAAHLAHLWREHTELRMLGSARRRRVPLKLRAHMFVLCALCGLNNRSTSTSGAAERHLTRAHLSVRHRRALHAAAAGSQRYRCDQCTAELCSRAELALHALDAGHACPEFTCALCGEQGEGEANAAHHRLWHRAARPFQCYLCAERFPTEPQCVAHVRAEHAAAVNVHRCARCPYATCTVAQFVAHARSHVGLNACVCHECGVMFQTGQSLRRHLLTHARTEFCCRHCDATFRHPLPLERHVRSRHERPDEHRCPACGKLFSSRYHLSRHALIHTGERPHACARCGRGFVQKGDLVRHTRKCRAGEPGEPLALQPPPPPPHHPTVPEPAPAEAPPPLAPPLPVQVVPPPPPPLLQHSVLLPVPHTPMVMPLSAHGAG